METANASKYADLSIPGHYTYDVQIDHGYYGMECRVAARSRSAAIYKAFRKIEYDEEMSYKEFIMDKDIHVHTRKRSPSKIKNLFLSDESLDYCRDYQGLSFLRLEMKVIHCGSEAYLLGGSDNIFMYLPETGEIITDQPTWQTVYLNDDQIIADYTKE